MLGVLVTSAYTLQACHMALHIVGAKSLLELDDFLSIGTLGTNTSEMWTKIQHFLFKQNAFENVICQVLAI